ncbi:MAG: hypothetical protein IJD79_03485 [Clostridia bacterium]|nr:hypothetical protein [Clostridia bacterium]
MKRIITLILLLTVILSTVSCSDYADKPSYRDIEYKENGLRLVLRNDMQRYEVEGYDFYFTNVIGTVILSAVKLDEEFLRENEIKTDITAGEYVDYLIEKNEFEKDKIYYEHDEDLGKYNFKYVFSDVGAASEIFYYVTVLGDAGNVWYVEMTCRNEDSEFYLSSFDSWKNDLKAYTPES